MNELFQKLKVEFNRLIRNVSIHFGTQLDVELENEESSDGGVKRDQAAA